MNDLLAPFVSPRAPGAPPLVVLGTMNFGRRTPKDEALRIAARAVERGVRLFDTANVYADGQSERIVGEAARAHPGAFAVATKVGAARGEGLSPARVVASLGESRERLGGAGVDLFYGHVPDPATPMADTARAFGELVARGEVSAWGLSNHASWQVLESIFACDAAGVPRPTVAQQLYNVLVRQLDVEYLRFARAYGLHTTVYNPLAGGLLSGRHVSLEHAPKGGRFDGNAMYRKRYWSERLLALALALDEIARAAGLSLVRLSYAWLAGREGVSSVLVGPATVAHLDDALDALAGAALAGEVAARVDAAWLAFEGTDARYAR